MSIKNLEFQRNYIIFNRITKYLTKLQKTKCRKNLLGKMITLIFAEINRNDALLGIKGIKIHNRNYLRSVMIFNYMLPMKKFEITVDRHPRNVSVWPL